MSDDSISRQSAVDVVSEGCQEWRGIFERCKEKLLALPSVQPTLYGYNIEHLELIARVLRKEDLPPEKVVEVLKDIGRIVAIAKDEFEEVLRKAVEQCTIQ